MTGHDWLVMRQDDNGNRYVVASGLTEAEAHALAASYEARAHKQLYWVEPMPGHRCDDEGGSVSRPNKPTL